ncbi:MAG TPA: flagellar biosynthetic protein FlhB, partial [Pseudomonas sp.]|nr:flagellar biosynthetic protein FlhB [Pseudomonas sp.]
MAESDSGQERTEEPTGKRLQESRDKGQVARSRELNTLAVVMVAAVGLLTLGPAMVQKLMNIMSFNFSVEREALYSNDSMGLHLFASVGEGLQVLGPLFFLLLVASIVGPVLLGGWLFSIKSLAPKFER